MLLLLRSALSSDLSRPDGAGGVVLLSSSHAKRHSALSRRPQAPVLPRVRRLQGRLRLPPRSLALLLLLLFTLDLLYDHATLADEQLYLLITVLLSFSQVSSLPPPHPQNASFTHCLFTLPATPQDFAFFTERSDSDPWSVGCLLLVLLIRVLTAHLHHANVPPIVLSHSQDFYLLSAVMALICNLFRQARDLDRCVFLFALTPDTPHAVWSNCSCC